MLPASRVNSRMSQWLGVSCTPVCVSLRHDQPSSTPTLLRTSQRGPSCRRRAFSEPLTRRSGRSPPNVFVQWALFALEPRPGTAVSRVLLRSCDADLPVSTFWVGPVPQCGTGPRRSGAELSNGPRATLSPPAERGSATGPTFWQSLFLGVGTRFRERLKTPRLVILCRKPCRKLCRVRAIPLAFSTKTADKVSDKGARQ
jgi:hypothetical protein